MAMVAGGGLAAAVSKAGGLGFIGGGYGDHAWLEEQFALARGETVGIGFITWSLADNPVLLDVALAHEPIAVFLSFGPPGPFAAKIKQTGSMLIQQVQSVSQARTAAGMGADIIVAQGTEAGGHGASRATFPLVPAVVDAVHPVPVVAAGGIADGRGLAAALMLGACGVLMGSRFYTSAESLAHASAKSLAALSSGDNTTRSTVFDVLRRRRWPEPYTLRTLENRITDRWHDDPDGLMNDLTAQTEAYERAVKNGDMTQAAVIVGEAVDLIDGIPTAAEIVGRTVAQAAKLLRDLPNVTIDSPDT